MRVPSGISPVVTINRRAETPIYRQVYEAFRSAIMDGRLRAGERIPSTRALALELGVSRIPVLNAYAQLLAEGYFESRTGSGTVISHALPNPIRTPHKRKLIAFNLAPGTTAAFCKFGESTSTGPQLF